MTADSRVIQHSHGSSSASAEDQSSYKEARDNVRLMSAQYAQAQERVNLLRGMFLPSYGAGPSATASSTTPATPATPANAATPTVSRPVRYDQYPQNDVERYPLLTEKLEIPATEFIAGIVAWMDTTSPAYPPASDKE